MRKILASSCSCGLSRFWFPFSLIDVTSAPECLMTPLVLTDTSPGDIAAQSEKQTSAHLQPACKQKPHVFNNNGTTAEAELSSLLTYKELTKNVHPSSLDIFAHSQVFMTQATFPKLFFETAFLLLLLLFLSHTQTLHA